MAKFTYSVWGLDVWGNEADGWETNDRWREGKVVIDDNWNDAEVIKALFDAGYLNTAGARHFTVGGDEFMLTVDRAKNGRPLLTLEREGAGGKARKARKARGGKARGGKGRKLSKVTALKRLESAWFKSYRNQYASPNAATDAIHAAGTAALNAGATEKEYNDAMDRALARSSGKPFKSWYQGGVGGKRRKAQSGAAGLVAAAKALKQVWR